MATDTNPPALQDFLTWRLHRLAKLTDRQSVDAYSSVLGLGVGEARCLAAIGQFAPLSVKDLAAQANLDKAQASRAAQMLVERDLVLKSASETDARGVVQRGAHPHAHGPAAVEAGDEVDQAAQCGHLRVSFCGRTAPA